MHDDSSSSSSNEDNKEDGGTFRKMETKCFEKAPVII